MKRRLCRWLLILAVLAVWPNSAAERAATRIAFLSDTHVSVRTNEAALLNNQHFDQAIAAVNKAKVDLVLIAGDLTDNGKPEEFDLFRQQIRRFSAPVVLVPGNHDVGMAANGDKPATITPKRVNLFVSKLGPAWFAREEAGLRIVGINSCLFGTGFGEEQEQWKFLEQELSKPHSKPVLFLEHYPLFMKSADEPVNGTWNVAPEPRQRLLALLKQAEVKTVLTGHLHYPITNRWDGILFLGNTATAFGLPKGKQAVGWLLLTVPQEGDVQFEFQRLD